MEDQREQCADLESSRERKLRAARKATYQFWRPFMEEMRQELAAAHEPGSEEDLAAFWTHALCEEPEGGPGEAVEEEMGAPQVGLGLPRANVVELREPGEVRSFPSLVISSRTQWSGWCRRSMVTSGTASGTAGRQSFKAFTNGVLRQ